MARLSDEQRRVLKVLRKHGPKSAKAMGTGIRTLMALSKNGLIYVPTTFDNIAFPQNAIAEITEAGRAAIFTLRSSDVQVVGAE